MLKAQAVSNAKGKAAVRSPSSRLSSSSGQKLPPVGDLLNSLPGIGPDRRSWPKDSESFTSNYGNLLVRNKKTGKLTHFVKPEIMKEKKTSSIRNYINKRANKK